MKKAFRYVLAAFLAVVLLTQCNKSDHNKVFNANFYTTTTATKIYLYVDDVYKGELPYFASSPVCGSYYGDGLKPIEFRLPAGEYTVVGKDSNGQILSEGIIKISSNRMSVSGHIGGTSLSNNDDCLAIGVWK